GLHMDSGALLVGLRLHVEAQFPIPCTRQEALDSRTCCPLWNGSPCGETAGRGYCAQHFLEGRDLPFDYRVDWPNSFYDKVCACYGNFDGFDCGVCSPGWQGPDCLEPHRVDRKEITDMTEDERELFISNLDHAKHTISNRYKILTSNDTTKAGNFKFHEATVYDLYVWLHYYAAKKYADTDDDAAHRGPAFPFWHRIFLLFIEREIRLGTDMRGTPRVTKSIKPRGRSPTWPRSSLCAPTDTTGTGTS
uniref:Tyrosinase copper-binding domain-containing protein n=1 Tax=Echeneis naucrates TaxID=173247 RepID=A0A665VJ38_ECHNA